MDVNIFYLELMFTLVNIFSSRNWWRSTRKKLGCKFIRISTNNAKNSCDLDYEIDDIEAFIDDFKNKIMKELEDKIKEKEEKSNKKLKK